MLYIKYLLWFQTAYAIWQFFRYTKFLRFPYIVVSSLWNSGFSKSWFQRRKIVWIVGEPEFNTRGQPCESPDEEKLDKIYAYKRDGDNVYFSIGPKDKRVYDLSYRPAVNLSILLSYCNELPIGYKLLPLYKEVFILKCLPLDKAIDKVAAGAGVILKEDVYSVLDETTEDYLNENFMRILSIFPLSLQARGFDTLSTYLSLFLLVLDTLSVPANKLWSIFSTLFIRYTKLVLARLPMEIRVPVHYLLSTGSSDFMFTDKYKRKTYWAEPGKFLVKMGNCTTEWEMTDQLRSRATPVDESHRGGEFYISGQLIRYTILEEFDEMFQAKKFALKFEINDGTVVELSFYGADNVQSILYKISAVSNMQVPPVEKLNGRVVYLTGIEDFLRDIQQSNYKVYASPQEKIYCS